MNYSYNYRNNPSFPYNKRKISKKSNTSKEPEKKEKTNSNKKELSSFLDSSFIQSLLTPIEKLIGRKISFDDILLLALIYILFTEKEENNDNKTLILCLLFILIG